MNDQDKHNLRQQLIDPQPDVFQDCVAAYFKQQVMRAYPPRPGLLITSDDLFQMAATVAAEIGALHPNSIYRDLMTAFLTAAFTTDVEDFLAAQLKAGRATYAPRPGAAQ